MYVEHVHSGNLLTLLVERRHVEAWMFSFGSKIGTRVISLPNSMTEVKIITAQLI